MGGPSDFPPLFAVSLRLTGAPEIAMKRLHETSGALLLDCLAGGRRAGWGDGGQGGGDRKDEGGLVRGVKWRGETNACREHTQTVLTELHADGPAIAGHQEPAHVALNERLLFVVPEAEQHQIAVLFVVIAVVLVRIVAKAHPPAALRGHDAVHDLQHSARLTKPGPNEGSDGSGRQGSHKHQPVVWAKAQAEAGRGKAMGGEWQHAARVLHSGVAQPLSGPVKCQEAHKAQQREGRRLEAFIRNANVCPFFHVPKTFHDRIPKQQLVHKIDVLGVTRALLKGGGG